MLYNKRMTKEKLNERLQEVYNFIVEYVDNNGFPPSVREICAKLNIKSTATAYTYIERLKNRGLLNNTPLKKRSLTVAGNSKSFKSIPLVGVITAGKPIFAVENLEGYLPLPSEFGSDDGFALRVSGESMINVGIYDKDIIVVKRQDTAKNGDIVVALIGDEATVKRFYKQNGKFVLHPENDDMEDMIFDNVSVLGIVTGLMRKF